jgi:hypothetical protein
MHIWVDKLWALDYHAWTAVECMNEHVLDLTRYIITFSFRTDYRDISGRRAGVAFCAPGF